jgi:hypothetical protein
MSGLCAHAQVGRYGGVEGSEVEDLGPVTPSAHVRN